MSAFAGTTTECKENQEIFFRNEIIKNRRNFEKSVSKGDRCMANYYKKIIYDNLLKLKEKFNISIEYELNVNISEESEKQFWANRMDNNIKKFLSCKKKGDQVMLEYYYSLIVKDTKNLNIDISVFNLKSNIDNSKQIEFNKNKISKIIKDGKRCAENGNRSLLEYYAQNINTLNENLKDLGSSPIENELESIIIDFSTEKSFLKNKIRENEENSKKSSSKGDDSMVEYYISKIKDYQRDLEILINQNALKSQSNNTCKAEPDISHSTSVSVSTSCNTLS